MSEYTPDLELLNDWYGDECPVHLYGCWYFPACLKAEPPDIREHLLTVYYARFTETPNNISSDAYQEVNSIDPKQFELLKSWLAEHHPEIIATYGQDLTTLNDDEIREFAAWLDINYAETCSIFVLDMWLSDESDFI